MNVESGLITKIETKDDLLLVIDERITEDFFEVHGEIFKAIRDYYSKYGAVPEKETICGLFPNFQFSETNEPLAFFIDQIKKQHKKNIYNIGLREVAELLRTDVDLAEIKLQRLLSTSKAAIKSGVDVDIRGVGEILKARYASRENGLGIDGYSTPWAYLNNITCGYHNGELIVWTARAKKGKSWLLLAQAVHIWREYNIPIIFVTKEMTPISIVERLCALETRLPYEAIRHGLLSKAQKKIYTDYADSFKEEKVRFQIPGYDLSDSSSGVSSFIPKVESYLSEGGVLFVDGVYLIPDDRGEKDWKAIVNVSMDLKNLALRYNIPVIATTQHNMEGKGDVVSFEGVAYGKYLVQFVDALIGLSRSDSDRKLNRGKVTILGQREGDLGDFFINMKFDPIDFSELVDRKKITDEEDDEEEYHL